MKKQVAARIPTVWGEFNVIAYSVTASEEMPHLALVHKDADVDASILVRMHSECLTGDLFGSKRCDCGEQLSIALEMINNEKGILLYLRQEGRGIGLINKLKAYNLQDNGLNTVDANHQLGFETDERNYEIASFILKDLGVKKIRLLTNNPSKVKSLEKDGIRITERLSLQVEPHETNHKYLKTKKDLMGHLLD